MNWNSVATEDKEGYVSDDSYQTVDDSDEKYEAVDMAAWGDTAAKKDKPPSWNTLVDTSIKAKAGGVGSGNLHRRGRNFRPVSEDYIIAQRLNKIQPSSGKKSKSRGGKKKKASVPVAPTPYVARPSFRPPVRSAEIPRRPPPVVHSLTTLRKPAENSPWGSLPLSETPFWKTKEKATSPLEAAIVVASSNAPIAPAPLSSFNTPIAPTPSSSFDSPIAPTPSSFNTPITPVPSSSSSSTISNISSRIISNATIPKWNAQAPGFTPSSRTSTPTNNWNMGVAKFNPNIPSFTPSTPPLAAVAASSNSSSTTNSSIKTIYNTNAPEFLPFVQIPVKQTIKITPPTAELDKTIIPPAGTLTLTASTAITAKVPERPTPSRLTNNPLLRNQLKTINSGLLRPTPPAPTTTLAFTMEQMKNLGMESQTGPESTRGLEEPKPFLQIDMQFAPGISTEILVYENSDPMEIVEEFAAYHRLNITNTAKAGIARTVAHLLNTKKASLGI